MMVIIFRLSLLRRRGLLRTREWAVGSWGRRGMRGLRGQIILSRTRSTKTFSGIRFGLMSTFEYFGCGMVEFVVWRFLVVL